MRFFWWVQAYCSTTKKSEVAFAGRRAHPTNFDSGRSGWRNGGGERNRGRRAKRTEICAQAAVCFSITYALVFLFFFSFLCGRESVALVLLYDISCSIDQREGG